mmetsp:Transcript_4976/g.7725  ORF Transcript_4976/g.7725 Transcript_4976/m.7725 type:complete len:149 (-) Transcript_4976:56-502(-)|eukprot:CAMPEP_0184644670 /NCGR_PEP_ID=MMETSP0308-20130426/1358_1 /TAXON_ID=38269 /ORGANISM="Gloeochaete witrockiana, Strain SAG 46.84" /LENGTH=148 /DNA_ID=CAMNT_0027073341 /DNA_START=131 /DNA_END=577 /DNA_ORIENTATION=+
MALPAEVVDIGYGKGLIASRDCEPGEVVAVWHGRVVDKYEDVPEESIIYTLNFRTAEDPTYRWLIPHCDAMYVNHSCKPNCTIDDEQRIVTIRPVKKGEEFTTVYNCGDESDWWDQRWTFKCRCGAPNCQGDIDRYRRVDKFGNPLPE